MAARSQPEQRLQLVDVERAQQPTPRSCRLREFHILLLATYSAWVAVITWRKLVGGGRLNYDWHSLVCHSTPGYPWAWYESKVLEWFDTALILAAGRQPIGLYLRHHVTAASAVAINIVGRVSPTPLFDVATLLNAAVHAVQYSYYFAPHALMPMKRFITSAQIVQHTIVVGAILYALGSAHLTARPCDAPIDAYGPSLVLIGMYLLEFCWFFRASYGPRGVARP